MDATFRFNHAVELDEPYDPPNIPNSYNEIRETKGDLSNTWKGNIRGGHTTSRPKNIFGLLDVFRPHDGSYSVPLVNQDKEPNVKNHFQFNPFLHFLQNHPKLFPILRQLLGL